MSNASSSRRKSQNSSTFNASKKRDVIRNTILLKYKGVTPMIVPRSDSYSVRQSAVSQVSIRVFDLPAKDMVATARKHLAKTRAEVRNAATANIRLMGQHPAYGAQLVEITDDVWGELHRDLTEFTISIPDPLEADIIMLSDDEKQDYATPATGSTPSLTVDTPLDDRSPSPQISPPVSGSVAAAPPASRGKKRKASSHDVPSGHDKKGPPKIGKPTSSRRRKDIVNNAFVELSAKPTDPGKGKV
ncbi:hypothetical protein OF83DRAFT_457706 [Amylostereum chailletii]|nr:hypothetical protein OF83DRAFT_457706 [Amylostereum chailletii]